MRRGWAGVVGSLAVVALVGACSGGDSTAQPTNAAARELKAAAQRTLAEKYYKVRMGQVDVKHPKWAVARYQAPDRMQSRSDGNDEIQIGATSYLRSPDGAGFTRFTRPESVAPTTTSNLGSLLQFAVQPHTVVTANDDGYTL